MPGRIPRKTEARVMIVMDAVKARRPCYFEDIQNQAELEFIPEIVNTLEQISEIGRALGLPSFLWVAWKKKSNLPAKSAFRTLLSPEQINSMSDDDLRYFAEERFREICDVYANLPVFVANRFYRKNEETKE